MSHHHHDDGCCCVNPMMYGYGMSGFGGGGQAGYYGGGGSGAAWGIRWIYALLILIVIVLQFGRKELPFAPIQNNCCEGDGSTGAVGFTGYPYNYETIDRSVLFIIVVFLLILCGGCWWGGYSGGAAGGYSSYGSYGYGY